MISADQIVKEMTDDRLIIIWDSFKEIPHTDGKDPGPYDCKTMDDWCGLIYSEISVRGLDIDPNKFKLYWKSGKEETIHGYGFDHAFKTAGYDGMNSLLDRYEELPYIFPNESPVASGIVEKVPKGNSGSLPDEMNTPAGYHSTFTDTEDLLYNWPWGVC